MHSEKVPAGIITEWNSELRNHTIRIGEKGVELLSAGNKFIAIAPGFHDAEIRATVSFNFQFAREAEGIFCFRYDTRKRTGEALRFIRKINDTSLYLEYGFVRNNEFHPEASRPFPMAEDELCSKLELNIRLAGNHVYMRLGSAEAEFTASNPGPAGAFALARGRFYGIYYIHSMEIFTEEIPLPESELSFTVPLPDAHTLYPIFCRVTLHRYRSFVEAHFSFSGGVLDTPPGEGCYHGMRMDILKNLYFKVIENGRTEKIFLYEGDICLVHKELAPKYFYGLLHRELPWPFECSVRFKPPALQYLLALGSDFYMCSTAVTQSQSPSETLFTPEGTILYSGLGLTEGKCLVEFQSRPDKAIIERLPAGDPRYGKAVEFARNNHYFMEGETPGFKITLSSFTALPSQVELLLEDVFFNPLRTLEYSAEHTEKLTGPLTLKQLVCCPELAAMPPGVYHLRCRSCDSSLNVIEEYCAFEYMSREKGALPPPAISGLPFLYNSRTETRGLETDGFDPWFGRSVNEGHYISCTNFLPACARKNHIAPTVHLYGREWFLWLGTRCSDNPAIADNLDLIAEADYVSIDEYLKTNSLLILSSYTGERLEYALDFMRQTADPEFGPALDAGTFGYHEFCRIAESYWPDFLEFMNRKAAVHRNYELAELRKLNPELRLASYGPTPIYGSHYKGPEWAFDRDNAYPEKGTVGFWQYEDYPHTCRYGIERGVYTMTSFLMTMPDQRIFPEIYTYNLQGCPDGLVFYAHPPFGVVPPFIPQKLRGDFFEYAGAGVYFAGNAFRFWQEYGFQACRFEKRHYEELLKAAGFLRRYRPAKPRKTIAFVWSEESWRANQSRTLIKKCLANPDVIKSCAESVPFSYETARKNSLQAGFLCKLEDLAALPADSLCAMVLPPLAGVAPEHLATIRRLHESGVSMLGFENVPGLEDLFGVRDTGREISVTDLHGVHESLRHLTEFCSEKLCSGRHAATDAQILVDAEIPVLTIKHNRHAKAAFFNVPPTLVHQEELAGRVAHGRESIGELINQATAMVLRELSENADAHADMGRLITYEAESGELVTIIYNQSETGAMHPTVKIRRDRRKYPEFECAAPFTVLDDSSDELILRLNLPPSHSTEIILKSIINQQKGKK